MRLDILLIEAVFLFITTFLYSTFRISSKESRNEEENL